MDEYKPNSNKYKEQQKRQASEKKVGKVVSGNVRARKKNEARKLADTFLSEDISSVKDYILADVLIPAVKKAVSDIVTSGIDMLLYGETSRSKKNKAAKVSYGRYYEEANRRPVRAARSGYDYDDIILDDRGEAEEVLYRMDELVDTYGLVSVADLYDLVGITGCYTDNKYGWTDIRSAKAVRTKDGYLLKMPRALPLD
ncbi:hypothetical protein AALC25_00270 [Lachnospiraceae bacterium 29-84]